jgi:hypothetical protein
MKSTETRIQELVADWITNQDGKALSGLTLLKKW